MNKILNCLAGLVLLAAFPGLAPAQDAGTLLRQQESRSQPQLPPASQDTEEETISIPEDPPPVTDEEGTTVQITALHFSGDATLLSPEYRRSLADSVVGQRLGIRGLRALADRITAQLQQRGHLLAFALLPPQDVTEGQVTVEIRQGRLEEVVFEPEKGVRVRAGLLHAIGEKPLTGGVTRAHLEESLLRLNDLPGISARGRLAAGETANGSRLHISIKEAPLFNATLHSNNYGVASTGEIQTVAGLSLSDASGYGDYSSLVLSVAKGQRYAAIGTSLPLGAGGASARVRFSRLNYEHREEPGKLLELEGHAQVASLGLDYRPIRSRSLNLTLYADYLWKTLVDESLLGILQDKESQSLRLGVSAEHHDDWLGGGVTVAELQYTAGELDLSAAPDALAADRAGLRTHGDFSHWNLRLNRLQFLPGNLSLFAQLNGQRAGKNLDSSEELSLGGPFGVRGWPVSEAQGDSGLLTTLELRYTWDQWQLNTFFDAGRIHINRNPKGIPPGNDCQCNSYNLKSAGLGVNWLHRRWTASATWARGLGDNPGRDLVAGSSAGEDGDKQQFWFQASLRF